MWVVRHSSSDRDTRQFWRPAAAGVKIVVALLSLSACNPGSSLETSVNRDPIAMQADLLTGTAKKADQPKPADLPATRYGKSGINDLPKVTSSYQAPEKQVGFDPTAEPTLTAGCRYILALTGAETTILRSPSLSSDVDDEGSVGVTLGYDVLDLKRASLKEELAIAQCHRQEAAQKISQMLVTSPQALTRAGYLAKARSLKRDEPKLLAISRQIEHSLRDGEITLPRANGLRQLVNLVQSRAASANGEAARREVFDKILATDLRQVDKQLTASSRRIQQIERKLRTTDALEMRVSGGYNTDTDRGRENFFNDDAELYANVKMSVRLGAFAPARQAFEDEAERARLDRLSEENSGILWRAVEIRRANQKARDALIAQHKDLQKAYDEAVRSRKIASGKHEEELRAIALRAQVDVIALKAEIAGIKATIADTKRIDEKLRFLR